MSHNAITVRNIGKQYKLGFTHEFTRYRSLRDAITYRTKRLFQSAGRITRLETSGSDASDPSASFPLRTPGDVPAREFWALRDIDFDVEKGEALGIIGANGAGKSTLLKILCQITEPTEGEIRIKGRVASLLEVGTGFHQELSGRENVYMNGAILGMSKAEINAKFDEIVDFAGVEKFIDTPVKRYSSGMGVRLAFSVAAHLEPEILLVDEVLAVGDVAFQNKCLGKMKDVSQGGRTVLFVSHNMGAIRRLTSRCLLLSQGGINFDGATEECINQYMDDSMPGVSTEKVFADITPSVTQPVVIKSVALRDKSGAKTNTFHLGMPLRLELSLNTIGASQKFQAAIQIVNKDGISIYHLVCRDSGQDFFTAENNSILTVELPKVMLYPGQYFVVATIMSEGTSHAVVYQHLESAISFFVDQASGLEVARPLGKNKGQVHETANWFLTK